MKGTLLASATALALSTPVAAQETPAIEINPAEITCTEFLDLDAAVVPQLVYFIDGYLMATDQQGNAEVAPIVRVEREWLTTPIADVQTQCEANPDMLVSDVIAEQRAPAQ